MKITHFTQRAWLITWERRGGCFGCQQYGICGIYNKKNLAQIDLDKFNKESSNDLRIDYKLIPICGSTSNAHTILYTQMGLTSKII